VEKTDEWHRTQPLVLSQESEPLRKRVERREGERRAERQGCSPVREDELSSFTPSSGLPHGFQARSEDCRSY
jgi:hypothetical protein